MSKRKWRTLRYRKNDPGHNVLVAVSRWIRANNGTAVVIGGIGLMDQGPNRYSVVVGATGQKPSKSGRSGESAEGAAKGSGEHEHNK